MGKKAVSSRVDVPGIGKGIVESPPKIVKGVEVQDVRVGNTTVVQVPTSKL